MDSAQNSQIPAPIHQKVGDSLLTKKEAAARLALSTRTLDRLAEQSLIRKVYIGGAVRIRESEIEAIIENGI